MAAEYFLYTTEYNNTLIDRSNDSFAPSPPYGEILIDYFIPTNQPLYLFRESGGTIIENNQNTINTYLDSIAPPPQPEDNVEYESFTGYTATTTTLIDTKLSLSGGIITGGVTGTTLNLSGSLDGTTVILTGAFSGTTGSFSSDVYIGSRVIAPNISTGGTLNDYMVTWNPSTGDFRTISPSGDSSIYCYNDCSVQQDNTTDTNATFMTETWDLPDGYYESEYNAVFGNGNLNRCAIVCFLFDGAVVGYCNLMKTNDANVITTAYITQNGQVTGGTSHTSSIVYRQCGGGTASIYYGAMRIQKIG